MRSSASLRALLMAGYPGGIKSSHVTILMADMLMLSRNSGKIGHDLLQAQPIQLPSSLLVTQVCWIARIISYNL